MCLNCCEIQTANNASKHWLSKYLNKVLIGLIGLIKNININVKACIYLQESCLIFANIRKLWH